MSAVLVCSFVTHSSCSFLQLKENYNWLVIVFVVFTRKDVREECKYEEILCVFVQRNMSYYFFLLLEHQYILGRNIWALLIICSME